MYMIITIIFIIITIIKRESGRWTDSRIVDVLVIVIVYSFIKHGMSERRPHADKIIRI